MPASILMKVVLPVPFSPSITRISLSVKDPSSTSSLKLPCDTPSLVTRPLTEAAVNVDAHMAGEYASQTDPVAMFDHGLA